MSHWISRLVLVAALVVSQALFAGHSLVHAAGDQLDCQICLHASSGVATLESSEHPATPNAGAAQPGHRRSHLVSLTDSANPHPVRAPPVIPV